MYIPHPHQEECLDAVQAARDRGLRQALVVMATGLGKTVTVAFDTKRWRERYEKGRVLFLCHNNDILYQAKTTFQAINGPDQTYGYFHGEDKHLHHVDFLFASFQTMERHRELFRPDEFAYIVVDESHHSQADTFRSTIDYFRPKFLLGVTATPDRLDELDIREIFGTEVYYLPLEEAMVRNLVTPVDYRLLTDEIQLSEGIETGNGRVSLAALNSKVFIPKRDEEIAKIIARHVAEFSQPRVIVFCSSIKHCEHLAEFVPDSFAIHSKIPERERAVKLEMFRQGIVGTVLTVDAFNEGIDIPQANVVVFLRSTTSHTIFLQQLGRGLRKSEGKDKVIALDFVANCERIKMVHSLWRSIEDALLKEGEGRGGKEAIEPMTLNVDSVEFTETIVPLLKLMERVRPTLVSEVPHLLQDYSPKNELPANRMAANSHSKCWWLCFTCKHEWQTLPHYRYSGGNGCPACAGKVVTQTNNLLATHPELAKEYSAKNPLPSEQVIAGTNKKLWWECAKCHHEWEAAGANRINGNGCPACSGHTVTDRNSLAVNRPDLAKEYSPKNEVPADKVGYRTGEKAWWTCGKCSHEWRAPVQNRAVRGDGCPACAGRIATKDNNLKVTHPKLAKEYSSRNETPVTQIKSGTNKKVWWKCRKCEHEWQAPPANRSKGVGCPACAGRAPNKTNCVAANSKLRKEYSSRNPLGAAEVVVTTNKKLWWKCKKGHEWQAPGSTRVKGHGCSTCAKERLSKKRKPQRKRSSVKK